MYIVFTGFSPEEQKIIKSWSENRPSEMGEGFSVGSSIQVGRLVEIEKSFLEQEETTLKKLIKRARVDRGEYEDYLPYLNETRFFFNKKLDCVFSTTIKDTEQELLVSIIKIPYAIYFKMVDKGLSRAYLGIEEEGMEVPENEIELVEVGFLSRYLVCNYVSKTSVFLIEGTDFPEFQKIIRFIKNLGDRFGWHWWVKQEGSEDEEDDSDEFFKGKYLI